MRQLTSVNPVVKYPLPFAAILSAVWISTIVLQWWWHSWHLSFIPSELLFFAFGLVVVAATVLIRHILHSVLEVVTAIVAEGSTIPELLRPMAGERFVFHGAASYLVATPTAVAAVVTNHAIGVPWTGPVLWLFDVALVLSLAAAGALAWSFITLLVLLLRISQLAISVQVFAWPRTEVRSITRAYLGICLIGVGLYLFALAVVWLSPGGGFFLRTGTVRNLWILPIAIAVAAYLLACQVLLDQLIRRIHYYRLSTLSRLTQERFQEFMDSRDSQVAGVVTELLKWRESMEKELAWPFSFKAFGTMMLTVLLPAAKTIKELLGW
jgi:hypothetical protein